MSDAEAHRPIRDGSIRDESIRDESGRPSRSIVIVGMMGVGKTTVGRLLADLLGVPFHDSDDLIVEVSGMPAAALLRSDARRFRDAEEAVIVEALHSAEQTGCPIVLSLGGGAVERPGTRSALLGVTVVWLTAPSEELLGRVLVHGGERPSLDGDPQERMQTLLALREPQYREAATHVFDIGQLAPLQVAQAVKEMLEMQS